MKYLITAAVFLLVALVSSAAAQTIIGNTVIQSNTESALASGTGMAVQNQTNFAIVMGDGNSLMQSNDDFANVFHGTIKQRDANAAFIMGFNNTVIQANTKMAADIFNVSVPSTIAQTELNQVLVVGDSNGVIQTNMESAQDGGPVKQWDVNFAAIVGLGNGVSQNNTDDVVHDGIALINQSDKNIAYVYGIGNGVTQSNYASATASLNSTAAINQTKCNMAFVISKTSPGTNFTVSMGTTPIIPSANMSAPNVPLPNAPCISFPSCPCPALGIVGSGGFTNMTSPSTGLITSTSGTKPK